MKPSSSSATARPSGTRTAASRARWTCPSRRRAAPRRRPWPHDLAERGFRRRPHLHLGPPSAPGETGADHRRAPRASPMWPRARSCASSTAGSGRAAHRGPPRRTSGESYEAWLDDPALRHPGRRVRPPAPGPRGAVLREERAELDAARARPASSPTASSTACSSPSSSGLDPQRSRYFSQDNTAVNVFAWRGAASTATSGTSPAISESRSHHGAHGAHGEGQRTLTCFNEFEASKNQVLRFSPWSPCSPW